MLIIRSKNISLHHYLSFFNIFVWDELQWYILKEYHVQLYLLIYKINLGARPKDKRTYNDLKS